MTKTIIEYTSDEDLAARYPAAIWWGAEDDERLESTCPSDGIERLIDAADEPPAELVIQGAAPMSVRLTGAQLVERVLDELDQEHGDPDGDATEPTEAMRKAADDLAAIVEREYVSWMCDTVVLVRVDVAAWMRANAR